MRLAVSMVKFRYLWAYLKMKSEKEIKERIEDVYNAMIDLDNHGNPKEAEKLAIKLNALHWVLTGEQEFPFDKL